MKFREKLNKGVFVVTGEIGPPKGTDVSSIVNEAKVYKNRVDAVNVTEQQSAVMRLGSLAGSLFLLRQGLEPIYQMTCRDRNRIALQSDILSAYALGIENVLILTGDDPKMGDHPDAKAVFDMDAVSLLDTVKKLNSGYDMAGSKLTGKTSLFAGAAVNPAAGDLEKELARFNEKMENGAMFFQTQAVFDPKAFISFCKKVKDLKPKILAGILLLKSEKMANYINKNIYGMNVPDNIIKEIAYAKDKRKGSVEIACRTIEEVRQYCSGVHIMPLGWTEEAVEIASKIKK